VGLDFGFLDGRITGALDYYYRITDDLINVVDVPAGANFKNRVISNVGSLTNRGLELQIDARAIQSNSFTWDVGLNVTHNTTEITKLTTGSGDGYYIPTGGISSGTGNNAQAHRVGYAAGSFLVYETRINERGEYYFVDQNADGQINANDLVMYKKPAPDYLLNLTSKFTYGNWDLGFSLRANIGNYVYNDVLSNQLQWVEKSKFYSAKSGGFSNLLRLAYNTYWIDGFKSDKLDEWYLSDFFVEDASFLRCDNITLGYTFKLSASNLRAYLTVQNPYVITKNNGLDPEVRDCIDNNIYPRSMVTLLCLSLSY
jgi:iron complex outermembrane receptor protein